ncbi:unnamed protein product [Onchocerca flexuosa]|uniref:Uncharacterized protein n=1 Tax=Onchocerca flexuosa TaxID=387005 RepID=A0A183I697_9BILA|nr:unnamed protein product [Onchocerca flexuosa]
MFSGKQHLCFRSISGGFPLFEMKSRGSFDRFRLSGRFPLFKIKSRGSFDRFRLRFRVGVDGNTPESLLDSDY